MHHIMARVKDSDDIFTIGRRLDITNLIAQFHARVVLLNDGNTLIKLNDGGYYLVEL